MASRWVGWLVPTAAVAGWQALETLGVFAYEYLPSPRELSVALLDLVRSGELVDDVFHTLGVAILAAVISHRGRRGTRAGDRPGARGATLFNGVR